MLSKISDKTIKKIKIISLIVSVLLLLLAGFLLRDSIIPGWHTDSGGRYYIKLPFMRASGIYTIDGNDYLFSQDNGNHLLIGWNKYENYYRYSNKDGVILKGEAEIDGEKYCFQEDGGALYSDVALVIDNRLRYYDKNGFIKTGIVEIGGEKFFFKEKGNLHKGIKVIDGKTYYFDPDTEAMCFGLTKVGDDLYYFDPESGQAAVGEVTVGNKTYVFGEDGKQIKLS